MRLWELAHPSRPLVKVKQVVLPIKEAAFVYQSIPLWRVKQVVLLYQLIAFHPQGPILSCSKYVISMQQEAFLRTPTGEVAPPNATS